MSAKLTDEGLPAKCHQTKKGEKMETVNVAENLKTVEKNIEAACERAGRKRSEVTLIAVSKTKPNDLIMEAYNAGIRDFGENKVQELTRKMGELPDDINWHMIGHLQRNKVKYIAGKVKLIHSVDSLALAEEISRQCVKNNVTQDILIEVNIGEEESKFGVEYDKVTELVYKIIGLPNISVKGLMCVAPNVDNSEENRNYFKKMLKKVVDINQNTLLNIDCGKSEYDFHVNILSCGMTNDYEVAIEEGSTMIRVGTGIFGERYYGG